MSIPISDSFTLFIYLIWHFKVYLVVVGATCFGRLMHYRMFNGLHDDNVK